MRGSLLIMMAMLTITIVSIPLSILDVAMLQPSPVQVIRVSSGSIMYYSSPPIESMAPGIVIRVYLVNGSSVTPVNAFISVYANLPNGVMPLTYAYGSSVSIPFNSTNWVHAVNKWLETGMPVNGYNTSLLAFVTYMSNNKSWIVPMVIPYNVGWALAAQKPGLTVSATSMYIVATVYINVSSIKPFKVTVMNHVISVTDPEVFGTYNGYVLYNCSVSGPQPKIYMPLPYEFIPETTCLGINGSLPLAWVTWSNGVLSNDKGLGIELSIYFSGTIDWEAMAAGYGYIGASYSTNENWVGSTWGYVLGSQINEPGSLYWYYENAAWALVQYDVWYVDPTTGVTEYLGSTTVSEVLYVPEYDAYRYAFDYGNGTISLLYYGAIPLAEEYFGYSALNASSVVDYANFVYSTTGSEYLYECNGPVNIVSGEYYQIQLGGVNTAYGLSAPQLGTGLTGIALGLATLIANSEPLEVLLNMGSAIFSIASMLLPPSTSSTVESTWVEFFNVGTGTNLYISVVDASQVYGLPTFGFILNATHYYGNPQSISCKCSKLISLG